MGIGDWEYSDTAIQRYSAMRMKMGIGTKDKGQMTTDDHIIVVIDAIDFCPILENNRSEDNKRVYLVVA
jgi:hypothetical protein